MIRRAALYLATPDDRHAALASVAGRPVAFRTLMSAVRAGVRCVGIPAVFRGTDLERAIASTRSAREAVTWLEPDAPLPDEPTLFLPAASFIPPPAIAALVTGGASRVLARSPGDGAAADAEAWLMGQLGSAIDTWFDTRFHRRFSRLISWRAARWGVTPNAVTMASLLVGIASAWCFSRATALTAVAGFVLYAVAVILDHADGEVARLTFTESAFGEWLDVAADTIVHALVVIAMGLAAERVAGGHATVLGGIAAAGVLASALLAKTAPAAADTGAGGVYGTLGNRDGFYVMLALFIAGLTLFPPALPPLMLIVAAGAHAYWLGRLAYHLRRRT